MSHNYGTLVALVAVLFIATVYSDTVLFAGFSGQNLASPPPQLYSLPNSVTSFGSLHPVHFDLQQYLSPRFFPSSSSSYKQALLWRNAGSSSGQLGTVEHLGSSSQPQVHFYSWESARYQTLVGVYDLDQDHALVVYATEDMQWKLDILVKSTGHIQNEYYFQNATQSKLFFALQVVYCPSSRSISVMFGDYIGLYVPVVITLNIDDNLDLHVQNVITSTFHLFSSGLKLAYHGDDEDQALWGIKVTDKNGMIGVGKFNTSGMWTEDYTYNASSVVTSAVYMPRIYYSALENSIYFVLADSSPFQRIGRFDVESKEWTISAKLNPSGLYCGSSATGTCAVMALFDLDVDTVLIQ